MRTSTIGVLVLLTLTIPGMGEAQTGPKLAIGTIRGDASRVRRQVLLQLCDSYDCVAASRVTVNNRPDPQKMERFGVAGYLGGAVTGDPGERRLILSLTTPTSTARKPARTWRLRLTPDGRLRQQSLDRFAAELDDALRAGARPPPSASAPPQKVPPPPPPPPAAKPPPQPPPVAAQPPPKPPPAAQPAEASKTKSPEPAQPAAGERPLRVAGELGLWITRRKLSYSGIDTPAGATPLRTYDASGIFVPSLRLELYPAAWMGASPLLAGIGLYAEYGQSVGLTVKPPSGSTAGDSNGKLTTMDLGVLWRLRPVSGSRFVLSPAVGYRSVQLTTSPRIDGLPDTKPTGFEVRVDTEIPVAPTIALLAGGGYTVFTSGKELIGDEFFSKGSARGFEVEFGGSWRFHGPFSAKAVIEYQSVSYTGLENPAPGLGSATGADDKYLGGRIMLRGEY